VGLGWHHFDFTRLALFMIVQSHFFGYFCHFVMFLSLFFRLTARKDTKKLYFEAWLSGFSLYCKLVAVKPKENDTFVDYKKERNHAD
jgi:hypothetical protein